MKAMVGLVIAILVIFTVTLFWPVHPINDSSTSSVQEEKIVNSVSVEVLKNPTEDRTMPKLNIPADEIKSEQMAAEYKLLEKARSDLKKQLSRLKHEMWGLKFPVEEAKEMNEIMLNAHKLIKNPDLLGAFSDIESIKAELDKVIFAEKALEDVKAMIEQNKKSTNGTS